MNQESMPDIRRVLRVGFVTLTIGLVLLGFLGAVLRPEGNMPFEKWYWNWPTVFLATGILLFFIFFLTRPRRPKEWRGAGLSWAPSLANTAREGPGYGARRERDVSSGVMSRCSSGMTLASCP